MRISGAGHVAGAFAVSLLRGFERFVVTVVTTANRRRIAPLSIHR